MKKNHKQSKGFTLIELLVVLSLFSLLLSVILPALSEVQKQSRDTARISVIKQVKNGMDTFWPNNFRYPLPESGSCTNLVGWEQLEDIMSGTIQDPLWAPNQNFRYCTPTNQNNPLYGRGYGILVRLESKEYVKLGIVNEEGYCKTGINIEGLDVNDSIWNEPIEVPICNF